MLSELRNHQPPPQPPMTVSAVLPQIVEPCIEEFFANIYPLQLILQRQYVQDIAKTIKSSSEAFCMIVALCACVLIQTDITIPHATPSHPGIMQMPNIDIARTLLEESVRIQMGCDYLEFPTIITTLTSYLFYICHLGLERYNAACSYLQQAITQAQLLRLHEEETFKIKRSDEWRWLYWLLLIHERYCSRSLFASMLTSQ